MTTKLDARDVINLLRGHYNAPNRPIGWLFAPEIQAPNSTRRADLITAPLTRSGGSGLVGHEVKVSRSDVLAELADPTKHDDWAKYCDYWYLVVSDPALVDGLDIPEHWGIMSPPSGRRTRSMTLIRKAPRLSPIDGVDGWAKLARWKTFQAEDKISSAERDEAYLKRKVEGLEQQVKDLKISGAGTHLSPYLKQGLALLELVSQRTHDAEIWERAEPELIADAVVDAVATRRAAAVQRQSIDQLERFLRPEFLGLSETLAKAKKLGGAA